MELDINNENEQKNTNPDSRNKDLYLNEKRKLDSKQLELLSRVASINPDYEFYFLLTLADLYPPERVIIVKHNYSIYYAYSCTLNKNRQYELDLVDSTDEFSNLKCIITFDTTNNKISNKRSENQKELSVVKKDKKTDGINYTIGESLRENVINLDLLKEDEFSIRKTKSKFVKREFEVMKDLDKPTPPLSDELHEIHKLLYAFHMTKLNKSKADATRIVYQVRDYLITLPEAKQRELTLESDIDSIMSFASLNLPLSYIPTLFDAYELSDLFPVGFMTYEVYCSEIEAENIINNFGKLCRGRRISLVRQTGSKQKYWQKILTESSK